ncbi:hypothetical protein, partial [Skermania piniformis]
PRLWERVKAGQTPWWRARRIADATIGLSLEAAAFVDERLAAYAGTVSWAQLDRLVEEARILADPDAAKEELAIDTRRVDIDTRTVSLKGTVRIEGELDLTDAVDPNHALADIADDLAACGSTDSLDARRSTALGELARRQPGLPFDAAEPKPPALHRRTPRDIQLHVHIGADQLPGAGGLLGRVDASSPTPVGIEGDPCLVRQPGREGHGAPGAGPRRACPDRCVSDPGPAARTGRADQQHVCVPVLQPPRPWLRPRPHPPA